MLKEIASDKTEQQVGWLLDTTEKFCQEKAVYNAIMDSIQILDGKDPNRGKGSIPTLLSDALGVSFDPHIGHDFLDSYADRYDFYHRIEKRIPFDFVLLRVQRTTAQLRLQSVQDSQGRIQNILLVIHAKERLVLVSYILLGLIHNIHTKNRYVESYYVVCECCLVNHNMRNIKNHPVIHFITYLLLWISSNLSVPFWMIGHVHLTMNVYKDIIEILSSFGMNINMVDNTQHEIEYLYVTLK